jgi:lysophospholipase L1-like esterase
MGYGGLAQLARAFALADGLILEPIYFVVAKDALGGRVGAMFGMLLREENMSVQPNIRLVLRALLAMVWFLPGFSVQAQQTAPAIPSSGFPGLDEYRASRVAIYTDDFGQLARYRDADAALGAPAAGENRVVFLGDSITDYWKLPNYFPGKAYINRGIDGQTTAEMLVRFRQDVIDLHPKVLVVLAGTNDIAGVIGRTRNEDIESNYASMAELARAHHIRVVFASVLPVHNYTREAEEGFALRPRERILGLNRWLREYCNKNGLVYLDYFSALVDERGMLKRELADDGLHPTDAGYKIMAGLAEKAIRETLTGKGSR